MVRIGYGPISSTSSASPSRVGGRSFRPFTGAPEALDVVGSQYQPVQNEEHAEVLNRLVDESGAIFDTAGSLKAAARSSSPCGCRRRSRVAGVGEVSMNLAALNVHDGSQAFRLLVTQVRVVCSNTQHAALRDHRACVVIKHTASRIAARDALGMMFATSRPSRPSR